MSKKIPYNFPPISPFLAFRYFLLLLAASKFMLVVHHVPAATYYVSCEHVPLVTILTCSMYYYEWLDVFMTCPPGLACDWV